MKTLVIITHPNMQTSKVNRMWKEALSALPEQFEVRELYTLYPDQKIDVQKEQALLMQYDKIVFQFPFYWYSYPPLMKQYIDEVFTYGFAYGSEGDKLHGKKVALGVTIGGDKEAYTHEGRNRYTIDELLLPFKATTNLIGVDYVGHYDQHGTVMKATDEELIEGTKGYIEFLKNM